MEQSRFAEMMQPVMNEISGREVDQALADHLNDVFPAEGDFFTSIRAACDEAIRDGWMCANGDDGRRFGRVVEASEETRNLSVDVVKLRDVIGPHHRHPTGEICLTMPVTEGAKFDGKGAGWCVYPPNSAHYPTVRGGEALVLYLLPDGEIEFTGRKPPEKKSD